VPALVRRPITAASWADRGWLRNILANARYAPFAAPWNLAGFPAMAMPAGSRADGLPLGVQLVVRPGGESLALSVAAQLGQLQPWPRHAPAYS
jgi:amidase